MLGFFRQGRRVGLYYRRGRWLSDCRQPLTLSHCTILVACSARLQFSSLFSHLPIPLHQYSDAPAIARLPAGFGGTTEWCESSQRAISSEAFCHVSSLLVCCIRREWHSGTFRRLQRTRVTQVARRSVRLEWRCRLHAMCSCSCLRAHPERAWSKWSRSPRPARIPASPASTCCLTRKQDK